MALYKRPGTKYYWMKFTFNGQLFQQSTKIKNRRDAEAYEAAFRTGLQLSTVGIRSNKKVPTFGEAIDDFLEWSKIGHGPSSQKRYVFACERPKVFLGKMPADRIDKDVLEDFIKWRSGHKSRKTKQLVTRDTVNREMVIIKKILRRLAESGKIPIDHGRSVSALRTNDLSFHVITDAEESAYLLASPPQLQDIAILILESGMRPDEVHRIARSDVHLSLGYVQVTKGKTAAARRRVYLTERAKGVLSARLKRFDGIFLFPQNDIDGSPATKSLDWWHRFTIRKLGFDFRLYDCRHTFATRAHENGIDLLTLAAILGHSSLKMVMRYAHPSEERKAEAMRTMQRGREQRKAKAV